MYNECGGVCVYIMSVEVNTYTMSVEVYVYI